MRGGTSVQVCRRTHTEDDRGESSVVLWVHWLMEGQVMVQMCFIEASVGEMYTRRSRAMC